MKADKKIREEQDAKRKDILEKREDLRRLFPSVYSPDVSVYSNGKVEVMFRLTYSQVEKLARLLRDQRGLRFS